LNQFEAQMKRLRNNQENRKEKKEKKKKIGKGRGATVWPSSTIGLRPS
jgi:hypothetical protein